MFTMRRLLILRRIDHGLRKAGRASSQVRRPRLGVLRIVAVGRGRREVIAVARGPIFAHLEAVAAEAIAHVRGVQDAVEAHGGDLRVAAARDDRAGHAWDGVPEEDLSSVI
jgi:hypothetical protein